MEQCAFENFSFLWYVFHIFLSFRRNRFVRISCVNQFHCANAKLTSDILFFLFLFLFLANVYQCTRFEHYFFSEWYVWNLRVNSFVSLPRNWSPQGVGRTNVFTVTEFSMVIIPLALNWLQLFLRTLIESIRPRSDHSLTWEFNCQAFIILYALIIFSPITMFYFTGLMLFEWLTTCFISSDKLCLKTSLVVCISPGKFCPFVRRKFCNHTATWEVLIAKTASLSEFPCNYWNHAKTTFWKNQAKESSVSVLNFDFTIEIDFT